MLTYENMINYLLKWSAKPNSAQYAPDFRAVGFAINYSMSYVISEYRNLSIENWFS